MPQLDNTSEPFKSARTKINAFFRKQQWKEALVFSFFVLLSLGFWLLQSLQQEYEIEINIPVKYKNVPSDVSFTNTPPQEVVAKVKDKGSALLNYSLGMSFAPIDVDMKKHAKGNSSLSVTKKAIEGDIQKQLLATTSLIDFEPQNIEVHYGKREKKDIPVVFDGVIHTAPGFHVSGDIAISPETVGVYASEAVLDTLKQVKTVFTEIKKGSKTITKAVQLQKVGAAVYEPASVTVTIPIEEFTEKTLEVPVVCTDLPSQYTLRTFPSVAKVTCSIPLSQFKDLSEDAFEIRFSFKDLEQNASGTLPIRLTKKPDWVTSATIVPDKIEFILEQNTHPQ